MTTCDECRRTTDRVLVTARNVANPLEGNVQICFECAVNLGIGWFSSVVQCNICSNEWTAVYPAYTDEDTLVCPRCAVGNSVVVRRL